METLKELANTTQRLLLAGVALAVGWILGVALSSVPLASAVGCDVEPPNYGSNGADSLYDDLDGEAERNQWYLGQGRDHGSAYFCSDIAVNGEGDNDEMYGGEAVDNVGGGAGRDLVAGNDDDDDVDGGNGDDVLRDSANQDGDIDVLLAVLTTMISILWIAMVWTFSWAEPGTMDVSLTIKTTRPHASTIEGHPEIPSIPDRGGSTGEYPEPSDATGRCLPPVSAVLLGAC